MHDLMEAAPEAASSFSLQEYLGILRRRRAIILQAFVIVLVAGVLITLFETPAYQAQGEVLVQPPTFSINTVNGDDPLGDLFKGNAEYSVPTDIEVLQSSQLMKSVSDAVGPDHMPHFSISNADGTSIITIQAEGDNPDNVANGINKLMEIYVNQVMDQSGDDLQKGIAVATKEENQARDDVHTYEKQIEAFKHQTGVPELEGARDDAMRAADSLGQQYISANVEYQILEANIANTESQLAQIRQKPLLNELDKSGVSIATQSLIDPKVQQVTDQIHQVKIQRDVLTARGVGPMTPDAITLDKQLDELQRQREEMVATVVQRGSIVDPNLLRREDQLMDMTIEAGAKQKQLELIRKELDIASKRVASFPKIEFTLTDLQDGLTEAKERLESYASKAYDLDLRAKIRRHPATVLEPAEVPLSPIRPKKAQSILIAALLGIIAGLALAMMQEMFDDRINSPEDAERALNMPNLGYIPLIEEEGLRLIRDISTFSPLMESYRTLRTNINFAAVGADVKSILVASSVPAEGKSTTCANLAMAMALDGKRVIIVDADLRRPSQHKLFKVASSPGLTDILVGTHTIEDVIQPTKVEGVSIIPAGSPPPNPAELLGSAAMGNFLANVEALADVVLFDSPPALAVADGVVLASRVDGVLLVIGFSETKKANTRQAKAVLGRANAHILGTVLNRMLGPSSGYYYGKYYVPTIDTASLAAGGNGGNGGGSNGGDGGTGGAGVALLTDATPSSAAETADRGSDGKK